MNNEMTNQHWQPPLPEPQMEAAYAAVRSHLAVDERSRVVNSLQNFTLALTHDPVFGGHIRLNRFTERVAIDCPVWWNRAAPSITDTDVAFLKLHLEQHYGLKYDLYIHNALSIVAANQAFHPVQDRLRSLQWDGVPRVRVALHHFLGAEVSDYNERCLRLFMLGAVKRAFEPGCKFELMLVLVGGQGAGKTSFIRFLAMEPQWFSDDICKLDDREMFHRLSGHWIIELSEMVATANSKSIEEIKSFLSRDKDHLRIAYTRYAEEHPRQCVFAGTTNRTDFLPLDRSGNRRFLPVQVDASRADCHILDDPAASRAYFEQMWAEIMVAYDAGQRSTHLTREEEALLLEEQRAYCQEDTLAGRIYSYLEQCEADKVCSLQIYRDGLAHPCEEPKVYEIREIRDIVNSGIACGAITGWKAFQNARLFPRYGRQRGWERIPPAPAKDPLQLYIPVDSPECPF